MELAIFEEKSSKKDMSISIAPIFKDYAEKKAQIEHVYSLMVGEESGIGYFTNSLSLGGEISGKLFDLERAVSLLNAECWDKALKYTDVLDCMNAEKRNEWFESIRERKTPEFTPEIVIPTINNLLASRVDFVAEKVFGVFKNLSSNHKTNTNYGFRNKMIVDYFVTTYGGSYYSVDHRRCEYLDDLISVIRLINDQDSSNCPRSYSLLSKLVDDGRFGEEIRLEGGNILLKLFKKGTVHIRVSGEVADALNRFLSKLSPLAIPSESEKNSQNKGFKKVTVIKNLIPIDVINMLDSILYYSKRGPGEASFHIDIKKAKKNGLLEILNSIGCEVDSKGFAKHPDNTEFRSLVLEVILSREYPDKKGNQFYPTPEDLAEEMLCMADAKEGESILEPSAGRGALVKGVADKSRVDCVELSSVNAEYLKSQGFNVIGSDFIDLSTDLKYDLVIMNPPFCSGQAQEHLKKALEHLKPGGRVVACLPASMAQKSYKGFEAEYSEVYRDKFEGTGASVVLARFSLAN